MALTTPLHRPRQAVRPAPRPRLAVLSRPETTRSPLPFALLITVIVLATLATMLVLNIEMSSTSYELTRLQARSQALTEEEQALAERNEQLGTPQELDRRAREIGMVGTDDPAYIDLATGTVIGGSGAADDAPAPESVSGLENPTNPSSIPPAQIYQDQSVYHGMGNEGA